MLIAIHLDITGSCSASGGSSCRQEAMYVQVAAVCDRSTTWLYTNIHVTSRKVALQGDKEQP